LANKTKNETVNDPPLSNPKYEHEKSIPK